MKRAPDPAQPDARNHTALDANPKSDAAAKITAAINSLADASTRAAPMTDLPAADTPSQPQPGQISPSPRHETFLPNTAFVKGVLGSPVQEIANQSPARGSNAAASVNGTKMPPEGGGTSVAKLETAMKKTENANKSAGPAEKILPESAGSLAMKNNLPVRTPAGPASSGPLHSVIVNAASAAPDSKSLAIGSMADAAPVSAVVDLHARVAERTHDMIAVQALRLHDAGSDSLRVVIKPGAGTQLSLELRQHGDTIDAQAVLQRGDFNHLSQQWPELQQRLEQHGVRLAPLDRGVPAEPPRSDSDYSMVRAPLGHESATANSGENGFQQQQRQPTEQDPLVASAFAEFALARPANPSFGPSVVSTGPRRGWESWA